MHNAGTIDFKVYEKGSEYLGLASVALPDVSRKSFTVNGAGIGGDFDLPVCGQFDAMSMTINFRDDAPGASKLFTFRRHTIELRSAHEDYYEASGKINIHSHKYVCEVIPKSQKNGTLAPASAQATSGDFSVLSFKEYINGKLIRNVNPTTYTDMDEEGDHGKEIRAALGK